MAKEAEVSGATKRKFAGDDDGEASNGEQAEALVTALPPPQPPAAAAAEAVAQLEEAPSTSSCPNPNPPEEDAFLSTMDDFCWDDDYQQQRAFGTEDSVKVPYVGDKEPLSALAAEYQTGSSILQEKIKLLGEQYCALRRTRGDGNCFYRSFMFSYLEHLLETQDKSEVDRVLANIEQCKMTLQNLGYAEFTFEDFFNIFIEQLDSVLGGCEPAISIEELVDRSRTQHVSDYVVMFFRFATAGEIRRRAEFFEPFVAGLTNSTVEQFCKTSVEPMGEESDHVHIIALCDALGVPIRVVYLDRSSCDTNAMIVNHHDFMPTMDLAGSATNNSVSEMKDQPKPYVTLLYRPGHYDILYTK